jgi:phage shock protein C
MSKGYKQLYRSREGRMIGGVCAGLGEYFGIDPTLVRLGFVLGALLGGVGPLVLTYIIMLIVVPEESLSVEAVTTSPAL